MFTIDKVEQKCAIFGDYIAIDTKTYRHIYREYIYRECHMSTAPWLIFKISF